MTSRPPAMATISGTQWPAQNGGSSHSAKNTRRGTRPRTALAVSSIELVHPSGDPISLGHGVESLGEPSDRRGNLVERARVERQHIRPHGARVSQLRTRHRANGTQILGHDQVGIEPGDQIGIDGVERPTLHERRTDRGVDLDARETRRVDPGCRHDRFPDDLWRPPTLLRDTDERIDQAQLGDDLGCAGQQRANTHDSNSMCLSEAPIDGRDPGSYPQDVDRCCVFAFTRLSPGGHEPGTPLDRRTGRLVLGGCLRWLR